MNNAKGSGKKSFADLMETATGYWTTGNPSVISHWLSQAGLVWAKSGEAARAVQCLERASSQLSGIRDPISADSSKGKLAEVFCATGSLLSDQKLFDRGVALVAEIGATGFRGIAMASIWEFLIEKGDAERAALIKGKLMTQLDFLTGGDYCLTALGTARSLAKGGGSRDELLKLLETGVTRAGADPYFAESHLRDMAIAFAEAARDFAQPELFQRALDVCRKLQKADAQVTFYLSLAQSCAEFGLAEEAKIYLDKADALSKSIQDEWDSSQTQKSISAARLVIGLLLDDPKLIKAGQKDLEDADDDDRESILLNSIEALLDAAKRKNYPSLAAKANGLAERLESPSYRHVRLVDRADFLARENHLAEATALIERAISDAEELADANECGSILLSAAEALSRIQVR